MASELVDVPRLAAADHPENRPIIEPATPGIEAEDPSPPVSFCRSVATMWLAGVVGSVLTLMTVAYPLGAGDTTAALSMLPMALVLIAIVNGWIAANLYLASRTPR